MRLLGHFVHWQSPKSDILVSDMARVPPSVQVYEIFQFYHATGKIVSKQSKQCVVSYKSKLNNLVRMQFFKNQFLQIIPIADFR